MPAMQTKSQRAKLRKAAALKGWETRRQKKAALNYLLWRELEEIADQERRANAQRRAAAENTKLLAHKPEPDPNPWLRVRAWLRRMVRR